MSVLVAAAVRECSKCLQMKPDAEFRPAQHVCRECRAVARRLHYQANRQKGLDDARAYAQAHAEERAEYMRQWRAANAEPLREYERTYKLANRAKIMERQRLRRAEDIEATREQSRRSEELRRARRAAVVTIPFTRNQLNARLAFYGHRCWMCGAPFEHLDHVKPICKGGPHMLANIRPACARCNLRKGGR